MSQVLAMFHRLMTGQENLRAELGGLRGEVGELRAEIGELRSGQAQLRADHDQLCAEVERLRRAGRAAWRHDGADRPSAAPTTRAA